MNNELTNELSSLIDYLDKVIQMLQCYGLKTREQEIAIQKLEEAVF